MRFENRISVIRSHRIIAKALIDGKMGKAQSLAERIRQTKEDFEKQLDGVASSLDDFDKRRPAILAQTQAFISSLSSDATELEKELQTLSNLPLDKST